MNRASQRLEAATHRTPQTVDTLAPWGPDPDPMSVELSSELLDAVAAPRVWVLRIGDKYWHTRKQVVSVPDLAIVRSCIHRTTAPRRRRVLFCVNEVMTSTGDSSSSASYRNPPPGLGLISFPPCRSVIRVVCLVLRLPVLSSSSRLSVY